MCACKIVLCATFVALVAGTVAAQTPVLGNIEAPYRNLQASVHIAGNSYGSGAVPYGPIGTPLILTGSNLGTNGTVQFVGYKNGVPDPGYTIQATVTMWSSNMLFLTVPSGATSGLVTVTVNGITSNGLPFVVTSGNYAGTCPASPPSSQLQITTASLHDGIEGQAYSANLGASGGTTPYTWSLVSGGLPSGLSLNTSGVLSGTPASAGGPVELTFAITDSSSPSQTAQTVLSLTIDSQTLTPATVYSYCVPSSSNPNCSSQNSGFDPVGNITQYQDSVMGNWSFQYDTQNRLMTGASTSGPYAPQNMCWSYDAFGNRTAQVLQNASCATPETNVPPTVAYSGNNQITWVQNSAPNGFVYDGAGDTLQDNLNQYLYDAEGRVCAVLNSPISGIQSMFGYLYDAEGRRIAKGTISTWGSCDPSVNGFKLTESYVLGQNDEELAMLDGNNNWQLSNVFVGSRLIATYDQIPNPNGTGQVPLLHFHVTDPLGTRRLQTTSAGQPEVDCQSLPFGDGLNCLPDANAPTTADSDGSTPLHFTGKERDSESANDYFGARYYASSMGRWMSPDWSPDPDPVPFADFDEPQSLNLYAYVGNNPLRSIDNEGHYSCDPDTWDPNTNTLTAGACHYDWSDFVDIASQIAQKTVDIASQAAHQFGNIMKTPGGPGCMGALAAGGGSVGAVAGGGVGLVGLAGGGVGVVVTEPAGLAIGGGGGALSGLALGMTVCPGGAAGGGGGGGGGGGRASGSEARLTKPQQRQTAKYLGMKEVKGMSSQGQLVFEKDGRYFSFSNTSHTAGEVFKELDRSGDRIATTDLNLNRIGP